MAIERNAEQTRRRILDAAAEEIHINGYQGMRIDSILQKTQLAKGALYHHFPNKLALGHAVVEEILSKTFQETWNAYITEEKDTINALHKLFTWCIEDMLTDIEFKGCPVTNLIQEMSALDSGFQQRLKALFSTIVDTITLALEQGQQQGFVRSDTNPRQTALLMHCCYMGIMSTAKCMQSPQLVPELFTILGGFIDTLRPLPHTSPRTH